MSQKKEIITLQQQQQQQLDSFKTVSAKIRYLHSLQYSQGDIARKLDKRPQHINNVLRIKVKDPIETF